MKNREVYIGIDNFHDKLLMIQSVFILRHSCFLFKEP